MNIDERLEALTMNLELLSHDLQDMKGRIDGLVQVSGALAQASDQNTQIIGALAKATDQNTQNIGVLAQIAETSLDSIKSLEYRSGVIRKCALQRRAYAPFVFFCSARSFSTL